MARRRPRLTPSACAELFTRTHPLQNPNLSVIMNSTESRIIPLARQFYKLYNLGRKTEARQVLIEAQGEFERIAVVVELCRRGHTSKLILSHDATGYFDVEPLDERPLWNYETIPTIVVPRLLEAGVSEQQVHTMMVENPRRLFEGG